MTVYDDDEFDSPQEAIAHYRELLKALRARKRALDIQAAKYGIATPAHVVTDLEEVSKQIRQLRESIKQLEGGTPPPNPSIVSSLPRIYPPVPIISPANDWASAEPGVAQLAVLQMIHNFERESPGTYVSDLQIADALEMELQDVRDYMDLLESAGDTIAGNTFGGCAASLTAEGRMRLRYRS